MENSKQLKLDFQIGNRKLECINFQLNLRFMLITKFIGIRKTKFFATHQHHRHQRQRRIFMKNWNIIKPLPLTKIRLITDFVSNRLHYTSLLLHCMTWQTLFSIFSLEKKIRWIIVIIVYTEFIFKDVCHVFVWVVCWWSIILNITQTRLSHTSSI